MSGLAATQPSSATRPSAWRWFVMTNHKDVGIGYLVFAAFMFAAGQLLFVFNMGRCILRRGAPASARVWEGARGLEWTLASPLPRDCFATPPRVPVEELERPS